MTLPSLVLSPPLTVPIRSGLPDPKGLSECRLPHAGDWPGVTDHMMTLVPRLHYPCCAVKLRSGALEQGFLSRLGVLYYSNWHVMMG